MFLTGSDEHGQKIRRVAAQRVSHRIWTESWLGLDMANSRHQL